MSSWNIDKGKKLTGGKINLNRKKRRSLRGSSPLQTSLGKLKKKMDRRKSGIIKLRIVSTDFVNALNTKTKKAKKTKILSVVGHPDNINYTRRSIITKGCIVKTEIGNVKITSRPSQDGILNGIMVEDK